LSLLTSSHSFSTSILSPPVSFIFFIWIVGQPYWKRQEFPQHQHVSCW
jgi:hypothetical protein